MLHFWMSESVCLCMCELGHLLQQQKLSEAATTAAAAGLVAARVVLLLMWWCDLMAVHYCF